ncbi:hypothetical protein A6456_15220 [Paraburkholderia tropica]|nr:hypothetical protein A6456_15220 [Paraburkholderia tropica]
MPTAIAAIGDNEKGVEADDARSRDRHNLEAENLPSLPHDDSSNQLAAPRWPEICTFPLMKLTARCV